MEELYRTSDVNIIFNWEIYQTESAVGFDYDLHKIHIVYLPGFYYEYQLIADSEYIIRSSTYHIQIDPGTFVNVRGWFP